MPLLYQSGYITIKDYDREFNYYTLDVPNKEVKVGLTKALIPSYVSIKLYIRKSGKSFCNKGSGGLGKSPYLCTVKKQE